MNGNFWRTRIGSRFVALMRRCARMSLLVQKGTERDLFLTFWGAYFWLDHNAVIDRSIILSGEFEKYSTQAMRRLVKKGATVLDIGANIGYYSVLFAHLVGKTGQVISFEPTRYYRETLQKNLKANEIDNCEVQEIGLSDRSGHAEMKRGRHSASLHWVEAEDPVDTEQIALATLDDFIQKLSPGRIDLIKIDVDGHEPKVLQGAWQTIARFRPIILLEISYPHYLDCGVTVWDFYDFLKDRGFYIYHEQYLEEIHTKQVFLRAYGNFAGAASNAIISLDPLY
jgi:FkbM family methyltransferase